MTPIRGMDEPRLVQFQFNIPQARAITVMANETWLCWGRGTGKTVGVIAPWILHKVENMPRSNGGMIGKSFTDIETKILQPLFLAFEMLGYVKDLHYVYGKRPPESWETPLTPIIDYTHVLSFPNGTTMELISLHLKGSANGKSLQWIVADESKFLNESQLREEVFPILRGHVKYFGASPWYGAKLFVTDKLSPSLHWILAKRNLHDESKVSTVIYYQLQQNELRTKLAEADEVATEKIKDKIRRLEVVLTAMRKNLVYFGEASAYDNIENLSPDYIENMKRSLTDYEFRIAIMNEDPTKAEKGFYPDRTEEHLYDIDFDEDISAPLGVVLDYQASVSPLISFQVNDMVIPGQKTLNFLSCDYVLQPLGLKHVVDKFCNYHVARACKEVYYFYNHTAKAKDPARQSFCEEVQLYFEENGWTVFPIDMGQAPLQNYKYNQLKKFFQGNGIYPIKIHRHRCTSMILAMDQTGTKETEEGTKKDKRKERDPKFPQEQATHIPDAFDDAVWGVLELDLYPTYTRVGSGMVIR